MKLSNVLELIFLLVSFEGFASPLDVQSGEFSNYLDTRGTMNFYRGFAVFHIENGHDGVFIRNRDLSTGKQLNFFAEISYSDKNVPSVVAVKGLSESDSPEFRQGLVDFMNFSTIYLANRDKISSATSIEDPWENYTLVYNFRPLLPLFRFESISVKGHTNPIFRLESSGIIESNAVASFFAMTPSELKIANRDVSSLTIPSTPKVAVEINGLKVDLDDNWKANNGTGSPGYWLALNSIRDSQVSVEKIPVTFLRSKGLTAEELCRLNIVASPKVLFDSVYESTKNNCLEVGYALLDAKNQKNYQIVVTRQVGDFYYIVNFSTFADIFDANIDYYKNIVGSLENQLQ